MLVQRRTSSQPSGDVEIFADKKCNDFGKKTISSKYFGGVY